MKVNTQGKIVLDKRDTRVGNFVFTDEPEYIKIQDINRSFILRLKKKASSNAIAIEGILKEKNLKDLEVIAVSHYHYNTIPKDGQCVNETIASINDCVNRWNEKYGIKGVSDEEDAKILQEQKELHEAIETLKKEDDGDKVQH